MDDQRKYYKRGHYIKKLIDDYCVLDIETYWFILASR